VSGGDLRLLDRGRDGAEQLGALLELAGHDGDSLCACGLGVAVDGLPDAGCQRLASRIFDIVTQ